MSSGSILPTFGAAPPNIRRAPIPRDLQPGNTRAARPVLQQPAPQPLTASVPAGFLAQSSPGPTGSRGSGDTLADQSAQSGGSGRPVSVSANALISAQANGGNNNSAAARPATQITLASNTDIADSGESAAGLSDDEQAYVRELKSIDSEVRAHEAAHASAGGGLAGRPSFDLVTGPDGIRYAVSGSVEINTEAVGGDPSATIRKLETVRRAALAPAKPSGQDRAVAAQAEVGIRAAQAELNAERTEERLAQTEAGSPDSDDSFGVSSLLNNRLNEEVNAGAEPSQNLISPVSLDLLA